MSLSHLSSPHKAHAEPVSRDAAAAAAVAPLRAVFVGILYTGSSCQLSGCVNDQINVFKWIQRLCPHMEFRFLCDDPSAAAQIGGAVFARPTRANILDAMHWLVQGATSQSRLWFSYSGHGSYQAQRASVRVREFDGQDEMICPVDFDQVGGILDDELRAALVDVLPSGAHLSVLLDCCFSGSGLDLRYNYQDESVFVGDRLGAPANGNGRGLRLKHRRAAAAAAARAAATHHHHVEDSAVADGAVDVSKAPARPHAGPAASQPSEYVPSQWHRRITYEWEDNAVASQADVLMISGCRDNQTSADTWENGKATGALTFAFLRFADDQSPFARQDAAQRTPGNLLQDINGWLRVHGYDQRPQLSTGRHADIDAPWSFL